MRYWSIHPLRTGHFFGSPDPERLQRVLNEQTGQEWRLTESISEEKRNWFFFTFAEHLLIVLHAYEQLSAFLVADTCSNTESRTAETEIQ